MSNFGGKSMVGLVRDLLVSLSYEAPSGPSTLGSDVGLTRLDERLSSFAQGQGSRTVLQISPEDCLVWDGNPRDQPSLNDESCRSLIESIAAEGGNRIPVLVRLSPEGSAPSYELLVGSRRRFAVNWLNHNGRPEIKLNALIVNLSDEEAFRLADIENREREDISELNRAMSYQAAVDRFYGGVQSKMAQALGLSNSQLSRLLALAQMPEEVICAFARKEDIKVRHSEVLTPLLRKIEVREKIIAAAIELSREQQRLALEEGRMLSPATVLGRLKEAAEQTPKVLDSKEIISIGDSQIGTVKLTKNGNLQLEATFPASDNLDKVIEALKVAVRQLHLDNTPNQG